MKNKEIDKFIDEAVDVISAEWEVPKNMLFGRPASKPEPGFYMGKKAFEMVRNEVSAPVGATRFVYNELKFILAPHVGDHQVVGAGEPYASLAKKFAEIYGKSGHEK